MAYFYARKVLLRMSSDDYYEINKLFKLTGVGLVLCTHFLGVKIVINFF